MSAILLPEVVIYNTLETIINLIRKDLTDNVSDDTKTILYKLLGQTDENIDLKLNTYNFFKQAKKIFSSVQNLTVSFGYNMQVAKIISLHILLPGEQYSSGSIGQDEGDDEEDELDIDGNITGRSYKYMQFYDSNYQVMITSDNSSEVNVVYNILKAMILALSPNLNLLGLKNVKLSGGDIMMQDNAIPASIFHKVLNLSFIYELSVSSMIVNDICKKFTLEYKIVDYFDQTK